MSASESPTVSGLPAEKLMAAAMGSTPVSSPAFAWIPPAVEEVVPWFPDYEVQALAGRGAMGAVYRAVLRKLERPVAIKLLPAELAARDGVAARFEREARALALLNHPGIVALHDFGRTAGGHLFIVMEYVDGTDLSRLLHAEGGALGVPQALEIVSQVCDALQYAHNHGFVHRDIKPGNVLVDREGRVKIADFGLAKLVDERAASCPAAPLSATGLAVGTPDYTAPEQLRGGPVDHRADIYSLGVMFYEMLTGDLPRGAWTPPSQRTAAPVRLDEVVSRALQREPGQRYQQASEVKAAAVGPAPPPPPARGSQSRTVMDRVLVWLMIVLGTWMLKVCPARDLLNLALSGGPFFLLAFIFHRWRTGVPGGILAGLATATVVWVTFSSGSPHQRLQDANNSLPGAVRHTPDEAQLTVQRARVAQAKARLDSLVQEYGITDEGVSATLPREAVSRPGNRSVDEIVTAYIDARKRHEQEEADLHDLESAARQRRLSGTGPPVYQVSSIRSGRLEKIEAFPGQHIVTGTIVAIMDQSSVKLELQGLKDDILERWQKESAPARSSVMTLEAELRQVRTADAEDSASIKEFETQLEETSQGGGALKDILEYQAVIRTAKLELAKTKARSSQRLDQLKQIQDSRSHFESTLQEYAKSASALKDAEMTDDKIVSLLPLNSQERQRRLTLLQSLQGCRLTAEVTGTVQKILKKAGEHCTPGETILTISVAPDESSVPGGPR